MSDINSERPFTIAVADSELELLRAKLALARWPDEVSDAGWDYGAPLADVHRLAMYWKDGYDWRKAEAALNADLPMFTRDIDVEGHSALNVHYVHQRSSAANAIPLIFVHGWPGSFIEVRKVLPLLTSSAPNIPTFHVVALSLPGYGWSEAPRKKGFSPVEMAEIGHRLMLALGYSEYVCQGGDWGGHITRLMASKYGPKHVKAWHTNMPFALPPRLSTSPLRYIISMLTPYTKAERSGLERAREFDKLGKGYNLEQSTKPQTIGYSLSDSPVGLLAWIYEKLVGWSDNYQWTDDEVLTWISIYWFSRAGPTAAGRIYYENRLRMKELIDSKVDVRTGFSRFPRDIHHPPRSWSHAIANVVQDVYHERGGHFAAYETPELLVGDLRKMFAKGGPAYRCVKNKL